MGVAGGILVGLIICFLKMQKIRTFLYKFSHFGQKWLFGTSRYDRPTYLLAQKKPDADSFSNCQRPKGACTRKLSYRSPPTGSRISWFREAMGFRKTKCPNGGTVPDFGSNFRILDFEICHISRILDLGANLRKLQRGEYMKNKISANWQFRFHPTHRLVPEKKCYGN